MMVLLRFINFCILVEQILSYSTFREVEMRVTERIKTTINITVNKFIYYKFVLIVIFVWHYRRIGTALRASATWDYFSPACLLAGRT